MLCDLYCWLWPVEAATGPQNPGGQYQQTSDEAPDWRTFMSLVDTTLIQYKCEFCKIPQRLTTPKLPNILFLKCLRQWKYRGSKHWGGIWLFVAAVITWTQIPGEHHQAHQAQCVQAEAAGTRWHMDVVHYSLQSVSKLLPDVKLVFLTCAARL